MLERSSIGITPGIRRDAEYENTVKQDAPKGDFPDFEKLMGNSNSEVNEERAKEKAAQGSGELRLGETKTDKEFREQLEKVTGKKQDRLKNKLEKDDYLTLMVTQMKMQDPTKPMENKEMIAQLAQFNSVEQLVGVNKQLQALTEMQNMARGEKLTQYLGMNVQVSGAQLKLMNGSVANEAFFELPLAAGSTMVSIKDSTNAVVRNLNLGTQEAGQHKIEWDGNDNNGKKVAAGTYTFQVEASSVEGKSVAAKTSTTARVDGIINLAEGGKLDTTAGVLDPKQIISVRAQQAVPMAPNAAVVPIAAVPTAPAAAPAAAPVPQTVVAPKPNEPAVAKADIEKAAETKSAAASKVKNSESPKPTGEDAPKSVKSGPKAAAGHKARESQVGKEKKAA